MDGSASKADRCRRDAHRTFVLPKDSTSSPIHRRRRSARSFRAGECLFPKSLIAQIDARTELGMSRSSFFGFAATIGLDWVPRPRIDLVEPRSKVHKTGAVRAEKRSAKKPARSAPEFLHRLPARLHEVDEFRSQASSRADANCSQCDVASIDCRKTALFGCSRAIHIVEQETGGHPDCRRENKNKMDASSYTRIPEASIRYDGWRIVVVCFLLATFGWGLGFYGQSVYVAELHRLRGWPASLISSGTTFFYLFGAALVAFVAEAIKAYGPRRCLIAGTFAMAAAGVAIGQVTSPGSSIRQRRARLRLGRHFAGHHHQHAGPVVRREARHGDQPGAERRQLWRHRRRAAAGGRHRLFRLPGRDDGRGRRHDRADGAGDPDLRRPTAGAGAYRGGG